MQALVGSEATPVEHGDVGQPDQQQRSLNDCFGRFLDVEDRCNHSQLAPVFLVLVHDVLCSLHCGHQRHWARQESQLTLVGQGRR